MPIIAKVRLKIRKSRHERIRRTISGTGDIPRLCVRRSLKHIYAQVVNDETGKSILQVSSLSKGIKEKVKDKNKTETSNEVGTMIAQAALEKGLQKVVFDRGGYLFHGRIKALASAARKGGLKF